MNMPDMAIVQHVHRRIPWNSLGLSEEQHSQIEQAFRNLWLYSLGIQQESAFTRQNMSSLNPEVPNEHAKLVSLQAKMTALKQESAKNFALHIATIRKILTPEQQEKIEQFKTAGKMFYKVKAQFQDLLLDRERAQPETVLQAYPSAVSDENTELEQSGSLIRVQNFPSTQFLSQSQVLRL